MSASFFPNADQSKQLGPCCFVVLGLGFPLGGTFSLFETVLSRLG